MALPTDPVIRPAARPRAMAIQDPDLCAWCLGTGTYLEALESDVGHEYLPILCEACDGRGVRRRAA